MDRANLDVQLKARAAVFATLGEPIRLALTEQLTLGDASPGRLADDLGLGTNLLAHHLHVLEDAGVIRRVRSEGDRRRSYIQLRLDQALVRHVVGPAAHLTQSPDDVRRVVFVGTANTARSQLAAAIWNRLSRVPAVSGGTDPGRVVHPLTVTIGRRHGLELAGAAPGGIHDINHDHDLVIVVSDAAHEVLGPEPRRLHWSVPDPVRTGTDAAFESAYVSINGRIDQLALVYGVADGTC